MSGDAYVIDCTFNANTATDEGGCVLGSQGNFSATNSSFSGNTAPVGGAIAAIQGGAMVARSSVFCENSSDFARPVLVNVDNTFAATCPKPCPADFDGDGVVGIVDFLLLLANWGPCP